MSRPFFHKLVLSSTLRSRKLRIPDSFIKKFRGELSIVARLIAPDGRVWHIGLCSADSVFWLQDGWQGFVEYYTIRVGFFLVFRYEGSSTFSIFIYNLTESEINYQSNGLRSTGEPNHGKNNNIFEEIEDDDSVANMGFSRPCPSPNHLKTKVIDKLEKATLKKNSGNGFNYQIRPNAGEMRKESEWGPSKKTIRKKQKIGPDRQESSAQQEAEVDARFRFYESASARKRTVAAEERERALNSAKMFEPNNPFCRVVLRPSYLYRGCIMYLPSCFAEKNLNGVSGFIKLQLCDGKQWPVRCLYRGGRAKLSQGWYEFTLENNLGEGDVCVIELLEMKEVVLKVTPFRCNQDAGFANHPLQQNVSFSVDGYAQANTKLNNIYMQSRS